MSLSLQSDIKSNREFIARRGPMLVFLLSAFAVTLWIYNFADVVALDVANAYFTR